MLFRTIVGRVSYRHKTERYIYCFMILSFQLLDSEQREWNFNLNNGNKFPKNMFNNFIVKLKFICFCKFSYLKLVWYRCSDYLFIATWSSLDRNLNVHFYRTKSIGTNTIIRQLILFTEIIFVYSECQNKSMNTYIIWADFVVYKCYIRPYI